MLEDQFFKWTQDLMKGSSLSFQKIPLNENHLSLLLKVKGFPVVVKELIRRVRPAEECQEIRLNLRHSSLRKRALTHKAPNEPNKPSTRLHSSIKETRKAISVEAQQLKQLVETEEELTLEEENLRCQIALLDVAIEDRTNQTKRLNQWVGEVKQLLPPSSHSLSRGEDALKQDAVTEELGIILKKFEGIKCNCSSTQNTESQVCRLVEGLLERHRPSFVARALSLVTQKDTSALNDSIQNIDLIADAKALRLKYTRGGGLVDELCPEQVLETVDSMLLEMSAKHIKCHIKNQRKRQEIQTAIESLANVLDMVHSAAQESYNDPAVVSEVMELCDLSCKVAGLKALLASAPKVIQDLKSMNSTAVQQWDEMTEKYDKIHHFDEQVESTVSELQFLTLEASQNMDDVKAIRTDTASIVEDGLNSLSFPVPFLKRSFTREVEAVLELPVEALRSSHRGGDIAPILPLAPFHRSSLDDVWSAVPYLTAWPNLIHLIHQKKLKLRQREMMLARKLGDMQEVTSTTQTLVLSTSQVKELCHKAKSHDKKLATEILPVLDDCESSHKQVEQSLKQLRASTEEWWNQPGDVIKKYLKQNRG